jgi:hypothetical protein
MLFVDHYHTNPVLVSFCHILITSHKDRKLQKTVKYWCLNQSAGNASCLDLCWVQSEKWYPRTPWDPQAAPDPPSAPLALHLFKPSRSGDIVPIIQAAWLVLQTGLPTDSGTEPQFCRHSCLYPIDLGCHYTPQATQQMRFPKWRSVVGFFPHYCLQEVLLPLKGSDIPTNIPYRSVG